MIFCILEHPGVFVCWLVVVVDAAPVSCAQTFPAAAGHRPRPLVNVRRILTYFLS